MILPDVNVLIYAFRRDLPQHRICRPWLAAVISGEARFALSLMVLSAVIRITTNGRAFRTPSPLEEAFGFCEDLSGSPIARLSSREIAIGTFSDAYASRPTHADLASVTHGLLRWRSSAVASGSLLIVTMRASPG